MTNAIDIRLVSEAQIEAARQEPKVFVRILSTPPGLPWTQARVADLETRAGAPLPITEVLYQTRRLSIWAPGQPGRYAVFYVRSSEVGDLFETVQSVEGRAIKIQFLSIAQQRKRARRLLTIAVAAVAVSLLFVGVVTLVAGARSHAADRLDTAEQLAGRKLRQATALEKLKRQTRALQVAGVQGRSLDDVLKDIAWASMSKTATARIEGLHWQDGYMAVEVRGDDAPFNGADRPVQKASKPARAGVWLWGVTPVVVDADQGGDSR